MGKIYVRMGGRLGNQLFRYAAARYIQELHRNGEDKDELVLDFSSVYKEGKAKPNESGFENSLQYFKTQSYKLESSIVFEPSKGTLLQKSRFLMSEILLRSIGPNSKIFNQFNKRNPAAGLYITTGGPEYCAITKTSASNKFVYGRFEDVRYFDSIRKCLLEEIQPSAPERRENQYLYDILNSSRDTVCISIRRGDYVTDEAVKKTLGVCTKEYFENAVAYMKRVLKEPVFIIFSDDIEWCKDNIDFIGENNCYFETGNDPVWEKLRLMYMCKHFIISNSTFSWWAQYLSRNENKIVVAPKRWFNGESGDKYPLLLDSFIKI